MLLHLTRHGQPEHCATAVSDREGLLGGDPCLSNVGVEQARRLGRRLRELRFGGRIWSSPYRRSAQTADLVAEQLGLGFQVTPALRDIVKDATPRAHLAGLDWEALRREFPRVEAATESLPFPWWTETTDDRTEFTRRLLAWLEPRLADGVDLLMVGHGATVNQFTQVLTKRAGRADLGDWFGSWNAQLTTFSVNGGAVDLVRLADVSFLTPSLTTANQASMAAGHNAGTGAERLQESA